MEFTPITARRGLPNSFYWPLWCPALAGRETSKTEGPSLFGYVLEAIKMYSSSYNTARGKAGLMMFRTFLGGPHKLWTFEFGGFTTLAKATRNFSWSAPQSGFMYGSLCNLPLWGQGSGTCQKLMPKTTLQPHATPKSATDIWALKWYFQWYKKQHK